MKGKQMIQNDNTSDRKEFELLEVPEWIGDTYPCTALLVNSEIDRRYINATSVSIIPNIGFMFHEATIADDNAEREPDYPLSVIVPFQNVAYIRQVEERDVTAEYAESLCRQGGDQ